ncbi:GAF domain-containing protein [Dankookia rubra]|uniref:histidine kinase n=1 Tax=Dankookia rubra TaxID=1442381 RepID=A0A4R5QCA9_9PROT|nr:histidine kinase dimerization/phosphoacceptor domain -containing protein [Dankookia rubra]TDH60762.1 GAF domain-containing protein [Dankookia rubra]
MTDGVPLQVGAGATQEELALRLRQQELIARFGSFALREDDLQATLDEACQVAAEGLETKFAKVLEWLPAEDLFLVRAGVGWRPGEVGHARVGADLASPAGFAFRTGQPLISNHLEDEDRFRTPAMLVEHGIRRALNVLIGEGDARFGVLEADCTERRSFDRHDTAFLQVLANILAAAVEAYGRRAAAREVAAAKDLLMAEIHHRVKNSLQMVQSMLTLQARAAAGTEAAVPLVESAARVRTIAALHDRLYRADAGLEVEVASYLEGLAADLRASMAPAQAGRQILLDADAATWGAADVTTLGLVLTELVTNALKYGSGTVHVAFRQSIESQALLVVEDEGPGLPAEFDPARSCGLGMRLVTGLLKGRGGNLEVDRSAGHTRFVARLPPATQ